MSTVITAIAAVTSTMIDTLGTPGRATLPGVVVMTGRDTTDIVVSITVMVMIAATTDSGGRTSTTTPLDDRIAV